ncbi:MAG: helix-turn-helix domain-containing protein [Verrucomicrobiia bacterium]
MFIRNKIGKAQRRTHCGFERKRSIIPKQKNMGNEHKPEPAEATTERLAYSIEESAKMLGLNYYTVYRLVQRRKLKACRVLRGKLLVPRTELIKLLNTAE